MTIVVRRQVELRGLLRSNDSRVAKAAELNCFVGMIFNTASWQLGRMKLVPCFGAGLLGNLIRPSDLLGDHNTT